MTEAEKEKLRAEGYEAAMRKVRDQWAAEPLLQKLTEIRRQLAGMRPAQCETIAAAESWIASRLAAAPEPPRVSVEEVAKIIEPGANWPGQPKTLHAIAAANRQDDALAKARSILALIDQDKL